jgi:hypothetical protein
MRLLPLARALVRIQDHFSMNRPRYFVDARRSVPFDSLDEAKAFARHNFPAVILERVDEPDGRFAWHEILRFDWRWDEARGEPVIAFY